jgi:digeranylgeranylglycerophospholipid reductase
MAELYDVLIVGAGPAGAMAAKIAGENGLKAAIIERKTDISAIRRICTMIVNVDEENVGDILTYSHKTKRFIFPHNGFSFKYDGPTRNVYGFHIITPGGLQVEMGNIARGKAEGNVVGLMIHKGHMCQGLVNEAQQYGVEVFTNSNINSVRKEAGYVALLDNRGHEYRGKFVIAADGVNSRIARLLGLDKERVFIGTYRDMARTYEGYEVPDEERLMFGLGWPTGISLAPEIHPGHLHVAATSYNYANDLDAQIEQFVTTGTYAKWFKKAREVGHRTSCVSNIATPIIMPFKDNVLVVGDSSWMQETGINGALMPGWSAANAITEAVLKNEINKNGIASYLAWYDKFWYQPFGKRMASSGGADMKEYLSGEDIDYLAGLAKEPMPATMNFFTIMKQIGTTFAALLPQIQDERPDIMQKLLGYRSHPRALALAKRRNEGCAIVT